MNSDNPTNPEQPEAHKPNDPLTESVIDAVVNPPDGMSSADAAELLCSRLNQVSDDYKKANFAFVDGLIRECGLFDARNDLMNSTIANREHLEDLACAIGLENLKLHDYLEYETLAAWRMRHVTARWRADIAIARAENRRLAAERAKRESDAADGKAIAPDGE